MSWVLKSNVPKCGKCETRVDGMECEQRINPKTFGEFVRYTVRCHGDEQTVDITDAEIMRTGAISVELTEAFVDGSSLVATLDFRAAPLPKLNATRASGVRVDRERDEACGEDGIYRRGNK